MSPRPRRIRRAARCFSCTGKSSRSSCRGWKVSSRRRPRRACRSCSRRRKSRDVLARLRWNASTDRRAALRLGDAHHGRRAATREGCRIRARRNRRARRQGREGPHDDAAAQSGAAIARASRRSARAAQAGSCRRLRRGLVAECAAAQVSGRGVRLGLAVCFSGAQRFARSAQRRDRAAITFPTRHSSARCARRCAMRASSSRRRRTPCVIRSRRTCSKRATTSARCRSYWVTATSARR